MQPSKGVNIAQTPLGFNSTFFSAIASTLDPLLNSIWPNPFFASIMDMPPPIYRMEDSLESKLHWSHTKMLPGGSTTWCMQLF